MPLLAPFLDELLPHFSCQEDHALWKLGLGGALARQEALAVAPHGPVAPGEAGALLLKPNPGAWNLLAVLGPMPEEALLAAWACLQGLAPAVVWDDEAGADLVSRLPGAQRYRRLMAHQALDRVPPRPKHPALRPLRAEDAAEVAALVAQGHPGHRLDDLFVAEPHPPSPEGVAKALAQHWPAMLAHPASAVAEGPEGQALGVVLMIPDEDSPGAGLLWDVAVSPAARGMGLGHALVAWAQEALRESGHHTLIFGTTEGNAPVLRLYEADSLSQLDLAEGGAWWPLLRAEGAA